MLHALDVGVPRPAGGDAVVHGEAVQLGAGVVELLLEAQRRAQPPDLACAIDAVLERLVSLIERKLAGAGKDKSIDLEPKELDPILKSALGSSGGGYAVLAEALKERGYKAFADGFIGVSAGRS